MILALLFCAVFLFAVAMVRKESFAGQGKIIFPFSVACGLANGVVNYLVMVLTGMIPNAILFPSISAGGILLGFVAAVFVYREKLTKTQLAGYFIGVLATLFLNL